MVRESLDGSLRHLVEVGALAVAAGALTLLALALLAELLRRARRAPALVGRIDLLVPHPARTLAVGALALAAALPSTARVAADEGSVRAWLGGSTSTSTSPATPAPTTATTAPIATREGLEHRALGPTPDPAVVSPPASPPAPAPARPDAAPPPAAAADRYVVAAGDCLWSIATRRLGATATNQAIDAGWRAIYAANRAAIGSDPGLIHPGLVLALPPLTPAP
jgi:nucleoid-associated protein YgaU